ncbi:beta-lactam-binding protein with PASTA domain [Arcticibacter tournemirensis]|uniref:PASTA domain-containing protein n=1 Tax=Arcticibacter tournemirensis TaxID=699437 RepID=A0A4Q0MBF1_9SPHI|nr:PASTA domain-containing protein [Arcticibacter tournemirensis]KAA8480040.1 PASTA domain-containing protein [Arcticibacter tournemirensis]RXF70484.1 PASTA domain-containing protein [Arcticibacter tournemirensis]TQM50642.1 beta-lactam-binding protein with PASTA domain [Arcticibacter tournemirensis]
MSKFLEYLKTNTFRKNLIIAIASIAGFLLIIFFSLRFYTRHGEGVPVPKLKGLSVEEAVELLESQGFRYQIDSVYQVDRAPGLVIEQDPDANTNVKMNRTIYLTIITRNAPDVGFPDIFEMTFLEARAVLSNYGIKIGDTTYTSDIVRDRVLEATYKGRQIKKGDQIPKGTVVALLLGDGKGASEVDLPNVVGLSLPEAIFSLKGSSLEAGSVFYEGTVTDSTTARVIKQYPAVSDTLSKVPIGTHVDLILSNGPPAP